MLGPCWHVSICVVLSVFTVCSESSYVAMFPYTPRKEDELELRKGEMFLVLERCQDGWFKGTSMHTGKIGVFPGNYMSPVSRSVIYYTLYIQSHIHMPGFTSTLSVMHSQRLIMPPVYDNLLPIRLYMGKPQSIFLFCTVGTILPLLGVFGPTEHIE